jgi:hypothetical protein
MEMSIVHANKIRKAKKEGGGGRGKYDYEKTLSKFLSRNNIFLPPFFCRKTHFQKIASIKFNHSVEDSFYFMHKLMSSVTR